ncbi:ExbD/TolR family protein [Thermodesulfobacteriota bacterium]
MAVRKTPRYKHGIDMTPMVDLGFLLVSFFMMMTQFTPPDPVQVSIPSSTADSKLPDANIITVLISKEGSAYFMMDRKKVLRSLGKILNAKWHLSLTRDELDSFSHQASFGVPASGLKEYLILPDDVKKNTVFPGIPMDPGNNELSEWLKYAKVANPKARIVIKGDRLAPYPVIKKVMDTMQDLDINRFSLITDTEKKKEG